MVLVLLGIDIVLQIDLDLVGHLGCDVFAVEDAKQPKDTETQAAERDDLESMSIAPLEGQRGCTERVRVSSRNLGNSRRAQRKCCKKRLSIRWRHSCRNCRRWDGRSGTRCLCVGKDGCIDCLC